MSLSGKVAAHERAFRLLLRLYPSAFRRDYGDEMTELFLWRLGRPGRGGRGRLRLWAVALADVAVTAAAEWTSGD